MRAIQYLHKISIFTRKNDTIEPTTTIIPELLERIIDMSDPNTQMTMGLVSHHALARSRHTLFANVVLDDDRKFSRFIALLGASWTSFTGAVESLHIAKVFYADTEHHYTNQRNLVRITGKLPHLKTLRLSTLVWSSIPPHIRRLLFSFNIASVQIDFVEFQVCAEENGVAELLSTLPPSIKGLTTLNLRLRLENPASNQGQSQAPLFDGPLHFVSLDTALLPAFNLGAWNAPGYQIPDITVNSFHVRLMSLPMSNRELRLYIPSISAFFRHVGPSLQRLYFNLSDITCDMDVLSLYNSIDLLTCVNLRFLFIGAIQLDDTVQMSSMVTTMWGLLSRIPSRSNIDTVALAFEFEYAPEQHANDMAQMKRFDWQALVARLRETCRDLTRVNILFRLASDDVAPYVAALHQAGLKQADEEGLLHVAIMPLRYFTGNPYFADEPFPRLV